MFRTSSLPYDGAIDADGHLNANFLGANVARVYGLS